MTIQDRMNLDTPPVSFEPQGGFPPNARLGPVDQVAEALALAGKPPFSQRLWDFDAMTRIAAHLRANPAPPYSGRQCEEFVLDARDRLYGAMTVWRIVTGEPPCAIGEQADVMFCGPEWYWPMWGMVTCWGTLEAWTERTGSGEHWPGKEYQWSVYDQENDRYNEWDGDEPTMWLPRPGSPLGEEVENKHRAALAAHRAEEPA